MNGDCENKHFHICTYFLPDSGLIFNAFVQPICIATKSNDNPEKWLNKPVEVLGFATKDDSGSGGTSLKSAKVQIFSQKTCNAKLEKKLATVKACKYKLKACKLDIQYKGCRHQIWKFEEKNNIQDKECFNAAHI